MHPRTGVDNLVISMIITIIIFIFIIIITIIIPIIIPTTTTTTTTTTTIIIIIIISSSSSTTSPTSSPPPLSPSHSPPPPTSLSYHYYTLINPTHDPMTRLASHCLRRLLTVTAAFSSDERSTRITILCHTSTRACVITKSGKRATTGGSHNGCW
jgi:hypothetical protein